MRLAWLVTWLVAWVLAGVLCLLIALVMVELGATRPAGGGTVRWPLQSSGQLVASVIGVSVLLTVGATAAEVSAILKYGDHFVPWLMHGQKLKGGGVAVAMAMAVVLSALNWFGVRDSRSMTPINVFFTISGTAISEQAPTLLSM